MEFVVCYLQQRQSWGVQRSTQSLKPTVTQTAYYYYYYTWQTAWGRRHWTPLSAGRRLSVRLGWDAMATPDYSVYATSRDPRHAHCVLLHPGDSTLQQTTIYCTLTSTQPPTPSGIQKMSSSLQAMEWRPGMVDWGGGMSVCCIVAPIVRRRGQWMAA